MNSTPKGRARRRPQTMHFAKLDRVRSRASGAPRSNNCA